MTLQANRHEDPYKKSTTKRIDPKIRIRNQQASKRNVTKIERSRGTELGMEGDKRGSVQDGSKSGHQKGKVCETTDRLPGGDAAGLKGLESTLRLRLPQHGLAAGPGDGDLAAAIDIAWASFDLGRGARESVSPGWGNGRGGGDFEAGEGEWDLFPDR